MRISDLSSDVCSSDLAESPFADAIQADCPPIRTRMKKPAGSLRRAFRQFTKEGEACSSPSFSPAPATAASGSRSEEHTSELQSLMRISYAVFCLKKKKTPKTTIVDVQIGQLHCVTASISTSYR